jgi:cobalt-zinc-cadmium efflux system membrane fusion protein
MFMQTTTPLAPVDQDNGKPVPGIRPSVPTPQLERESAGSTWQRIAKGAVLVLVLVALGGLVSHLLGVQLPGLPGAAKDESSDKDKHDPGLTQGVALVKGKPHTLQVPEDVRAVLGIRKDGQDLFAVAETPATTMPITLSGSTELDPTRLARIRARFAPARMVEIGQFRGISGKTGQSEFRELRPGDHVHKGQVLGVFYSVDVGSKKNDLLDALVQLELDQRILDQAEKHSDAVSEVFLLTQVRAVQGDRNAINRALNNLEVWDIPQDEIDALHSEAKKISADKNAWFKTREGRWVKGEKGETAGKSDADKKNENPWGRVTLRAPFDGVIVESNIGIGEMVVDNTVNLFQIADVSRLLVRASAPEDDLPILEDLVAHGNARWTIRTVGVASATGLPGSIHEIGFLIDPSQHTAVIKGYVDNPGERLRAGQFVAATVPITAPPGIVEIPIDALVDDGTQSLVFVQTDASKPEYTMRRVQVTQRFEHKVFVRSTPIPKQEQLTDREAEEGLLPKEALRAGERVLKSGAGELKAALMNLESQTEKAPKEEKR